MSASVTTSDSQSSRNIWNNPAFIARIASETGLAAAIVAATAKLLGEGSTVPFIARYRKEATGSLDEVAITQIRDRMQQLGDLDARRQAILKSLEERSLLTDSLKKKIMDAATMTALEDAFAPFRPRRRTRATIAREKGLEPLSEWIEQNQSATIEALDELASKFIVQSDDKDKAVPDIEAALSGARDIIAEKISDDSTARAAIRDLYSKTAVLSSKVLTGKDQSAEAAKFRDYFEWNEPLTKIPSHRLLAIRRGESEGVLMMRLKVDDEAACGLLQRQFVEGNGPVGRQMAMACDDSFKRLMSSSMETEFRLQSKKSADEEAVRVFADNIRELLMAAPLGQKNVLALDPGFRTGCKLVILDAQGSLKHDDVIYATAGSSSQIEQARDKVRRYVEHFNIEAIAIGNGTASRETESFVRQCGLPASVTVVMVNESGASIYSASEVARREFPDKDVTVRGAVSIGRRLMDPLAELVKIDPKSIGVGQYQHDVDQNLLKKSLDDTVVSCVNGVGVEVNTASRELLQYVSGLNSTIAENIIRYRSENGPFKSRLELLKVPRLGEKTFEQAAGFLRVHGSQNPLDASAVHPERYGLVEKMAGDACVGVADLLRDPSKRSSIRIEDYVSEDVGLPTLRDIMDELNKPGRDPREKFEAFQFAEGVEKPEDLQPGMKLPGIVTNVTKFGAFVDIGVHQDGLVHISQLSDNFVRDPNEVVKVSQKVMVTVTELDLDRKRIGLSMKSRPEIGGQRNNRQGTPSQSSPPTGGHSSRGRDRNPPPSRQTFSGGGGLNALEDALNRATGKK